MRAFALFAALALVAAPVLSAPTAAYADGIERPHAPRHRPRPQPQRHVEAPAPAPVIVATGPEAITLPASFFSGGGVGTDIGTGYVGGGTTVIVRGGGASAFAFASASASAHSGGGFHGGGGHGGGGGCGCGH